MSLRRPTDNWLSDPAYPAIPLLTTLQAVTFYLVGGTYTKYSVCGYKTLECCYVIFFNSTPDPLEL